MTNSIKPIFLFLFPVVFSFLNAQQHRLQGTWILDKITYQTGEALEVNHTMYSNFIAYKFVGNTLEIINQKVTAKIDDSTIITPLRKLNYRFNNQNLIIRESDDDKIYYFLKVADFIRKYPEFQPGETIYEGKTVYKTNSVIQPEFSYSQNFNMYIMNNVASYSSVASKNNSFRISYILSADHKIREVKVVHGISSTFDEQFKGALMNAEKFFKNTFGKDLLVTHSFQFYNMQAGSNLKLEKQIRDLSQRAGSLYDKNDFAGAIAQYDKLLALEINDYTKDRMQYLLQSALLRSGVANLALGNRVLACEKFRQAGDLTDFSVRNYLRDFCQ